jgi:polysaccharide biosynthesis transport protein
MVASAMAAEGKTTTAANLAVTFAQQGLNVVILDADFRRSRLHRIFAVERTPGATDVLVGTVELADVLHATPIPVLSVLSAGTLPPAPAELLGSDGMQRLLQRLEEQFSRTRLARRPGRSLARTESLLAAERPPRTRRRSTAPTSREGWLC